MRVSLPVPAERLGDWLSPILDRAGLAPRVLFDADAGTVDIVVALDEALPADRHAAQAGELLRLLRALDDTLAEATIVDIVAAAGDDVIEGRAHSASEIEAVCAPVVRPLGAMTDRHPSGVKPPEGQADRVIEAAVRYAEQGWPVIPVAAFDVPLRRKNPKTGEPEVHVYGEKEPLTTVARAGGTSAWLVRKAFEGQRDRIAREGQDPNSLGVAVLTGTAVASFEIDECGQAGIVNALRATAHHCGMPPPALGVWAQQATRQFSPRGGLHLIGRASNHHVRSKVGILPGVKADTRWGWVDALGGRQSGGILLLWPTVRPSGAYRMAVGPTRVETVDDIPHVDDLGEFPRELVDALIAASPYKSRAASEPVASFGGVGGPACLDLNVKGNQIVSKWYPIASQCVIADVPPDKEELRDRAEGVIAHTLEEIAKLSDNRNDALAKAAATLAGYAHHGVIHEANTKAALAAAGIEGGPADSNQIATIESQWAWGRVRPFPLDVAEDPATEVDADAYYDSFDAGGDCQSPTPLLDLPSVEDTVGLEDVEPGIEPGVSHGVPPDVLDDSFEQGVLAQFPDAATPAAQATVLTRREHARAVLAKMRRQIVMLVDQTGKAAAFDAVRGKRMGMDLFRTVAQGWGSAGAVSVFASNPYVPWRKGTCQSLGLPYLAVDNDFVNEFRGFDIDWTRQSYTPEPRLEAAVDELFDFIREVICNSDAASFDYIVRWVAWKFQNRHLLPRVALVLRSDREGTGKSTFANLVARLLAPAARRVSQPSQLAGRFNDVLRGAGLVVAEEAFFAGNPELRGPLYDLIANETIATEAKNLPIEQTRNHCGVIMLTNAGWAVPAKQHSRRFAVFEVSEKYAYGEQGAANYWRRVIPLTRNRDVVLAFAARLQRMKVVRPPWEDVPETQALMDNKLRGLDPLDRLIYDMLSTGVLGDPVGAIGALPASQAWRDNGVTLSTKEIDTLTRVVNDHLRSSGAGGKRAPALISRPAVVKRLNKTLGSESIKCTRTRLAALRLRPLTASRSAFEKFMGGCIEWEEAATVELDELPVATGDGATLVAIRRAATKDQTVEHKEGQRG